LTDGGSNEIILNLCKKGFFRSHVFVRSSGYITINFSDIMDPRGASTLIAQMFEAAEDAGWPSNSNAPAQHPFVDHLIFSMEH
jgi:hypothetical protein